MSNDLNSMHVFQDAIRGWMREVFAGQSGKDLQTRIYRFIEEALELAQSLGCTQEKAHQLVDYVFGRPVGEPGQELGGTMTTLAALANAADLEMGFESHREFMRINKPEIMQKIRDKQASKVNPDSPLLGGADS